MFEQLNRKNDSKSYRSASNDKAKKSNFGSMTGRKDLFTINSKFPQPSIGKYYPKYDLRFKRSPNLPYKKEEKRPGEEQAKRIKEA